MKASVNMKWRRCCFCKAKSAKGLRYPSINIEFLSAYDRIEKDVNFFIANDIPLPFQVHPKELNDESVIAATLLRNEACYHKTCCELIRHIGGTKRKSENKENEEEPFSGINACVTFQRGVVVRACVAQMLEAKLRTSADFSIVRRRTLELGSSEKCDRVLKQDYSTGNL